MGLKPIAGAKVSNLAADEAQMFLFEAVPLSRLRLIIGRVSVGCRPLRVTAGSGEGEDPPCSAVPNLTPLRHFLEIL